MASSKDLIEKWYNDSNNRHALAALINEPVMQFALQILNAVASEPLPPPNAACDLTQYGAMIGFTRNGAFDILSRLESLTKSTPARMPQAKPFDRQAQEEIAGS